jgi:hypothetical protein
MAKAKACDTTFANSQISAKHISGISNGKAYAYCGHSIAADYPDYWDSTSVGCEAFADMYEASVVNKKGLKLIKKYFPKSYKIFLEELRLLK